MRRKSTDVLKIGSSVVHPGERKTVELPLSLLSDHTPVTLTSHVIHGHYRGPCLLVCAALHGDEVNGVEIIRRLLRLKTINRLRGTLIAVPVVNVYGFVAHSRYLPDRRDLNRSFPGSATGSLAAQLAQIFLTEIVSQCSHVIDLHTGAIHRSNLPQIRGDLSDPEVLNLARSFGMPVTLNASLRPGSLREAAKINDVATVVFEGGEALRFDSVAIRSGLAGIVRVMSSLGMIRPRRGAWSRIDSVIVNSSSWVRAPRGGVLRTPCSLGQRVREGEQIGIVSSPIGDSEAGVHSTLEGIVIGRTNVPVVNQGDALFHVARVADTREASQVVGNFFEDWEEESQASEY